MKAKGIAPRSGRFIQDTPSIRGWESRTAGPDALEKTISSLTPNGIRTADLPARTLL